MSSKECKHFLLIVVIFIAACVETDIYLPAFPDMMAYFAVSEEKIQGLLTWNFIGLCLSGPFYGPFSDSFGRQKPLLFALLSFLFGSVVTVFAQSFEVMLMGRLLQGLGSGGCFTLGSAIIFDVFVEREALKAINRLNAAIPLIMTAAPLLGGYLNYIYGFRSNFLAITFFVFLSLVICVLFFDETLPPDHRPSFQGKKILADFKQVLTSLPFWQLTSVLSLSWAGYLVFLSFTAVFFVVELASKKTFPLLQAAFLGAYVLASLTSNTVLTKWSVSFLKKAGMGCMLLGGLNFVLASWIYPRNLYVLTMALMPYAFGLSWAQTPYFGEIMEIFPSIKGTVASLLTSFRLLITVFIVGLASRFYNGTIFPLTGVILGICSAIFLLLFFYEKRQGRTLPLKKEMEPLHL